MNILFITEQFPWPLHDGGNLRTWHLLHGLCQDHDVTLLSHQGIVEPSVEHLPSIQQVVTVSRPQKWKRLLSNARTMGIRNQPVFVLKNWSKSLLKEADRLIAAKDFDAVHFNHLDTACFALKHDWRAKMVFDSHNCLSVMASQVAAARQNPLSKKLFYRESRVLQAAEQKVCLRMDATLVCSNDDANAFRRFCPEGNYVIAPNGVDTAYFSALEQPSVERGAIVFTGAMNYFPNEQAALFLCRSVLPILRNLRTKWRVYLVGSSPSRGVKALHNGQDVFVTGRVPDVRPYLNRAQVVIVPLLHGSGTRLKILEAFAMGKAVVSTRIGAQGIDATDGREILLADEPRDFAERVTKLLECPAQAEAIGEAARRFVEENHDWSDIQGTVRACYGELSSANESNVVAPTCRQL